MDYKLNLLRARHSVRAFTEESPDKKILDTLRAEITMINTHEAGSHIQLVTNDPAPFSSFSKSYGAFRNPANYIAFIMDISFPDALERAGYYGEQLAIKCVELGLGTCFVGGTYNPGKASVQLRADWKFLFLVLFGYPEEKERFGAKLMMKIIHRNDLTPEKFFTGSAEELKLYESRYPWFKPGLEALACAPSSLNKQPVRICPVDVNSDNPKLTLRVNDSNQNNLIDLGIAKYNYTFATGRSIDWGNNAEISLDD